MNLGPTLRLLRISSSVERWPGLVGPLRITELGSQGHAAGICWMIGRALEEAGRSVDWTVVLKRLADRLCRASVLANLGVQETAYMSPCGRGAAQDVLESLVKAEVETIREAGHWLPPGWDSVCLAPGDRSSNAAQETAAKCEKAAQILVALWELSVAAPFRGSAEIDGLRTRLDDALGREMDFPRMFVSLNAPGPLRKFTDLLGNLRYRTRRLPGQHPASLAALEYSTLVAMACLFSSLQSEASLPADSDQRQWALYHVFYGGLFNRLHEWTTASTPSRPNLTSEVRTLVDEARFLAFCEATAGWMPQHVSEELGFWMKDGFRNKCWPPDRVRGADWWPDDRTNSSYQGRVVESCESLWSFLEGCELLASGCRCADLRAYVDRIFGRRSDLARSGADFTDEFERVYAETLT